MLKFQTHHTSTDTKLPLNNSY